MPTLQKELVDKNLAPPEKAPLSEFIDTVLQTWCDEANDRSKTSKYRRPIRDQKIKKGRNGKVMTITAKELKRESTANFHVLQTLTNSPGPLTNKEIFHTLVDKHIYPFHKLTPKEGMSRISPILSSLKRTVPEVVKSDRHGKDILWHIDPDAFKAGYDNHIHTLYDASKRVLKSYKVSAKNRKIKKVVDFKRTTGTKQRGTSKDVVVEAGNTVELLKMLLSEAIKVEVSGSVTINIKVG